AAVAGLENSLAPNMFPWSVIPIAGIPRRSTSASMGVIFAAPSSIEYSVWLCRCTKDDWLIGTPVYDWTPTQDGRVAECVLLFTRTARTTASLTSLRLPGRRAPRPNPPDQTARARAPRGAGQGCIRRRWAAR